VGDLPIVVLVRCPAAIPTALPAQSTEALDWANLRLEVFGDHGQAEALLRLPEAPRLHRLVVDATELEITDDPLRGKVEWIPLRR
jgi:hypothetical protein